MRRGESAAAAVRGISRRFVIGAWPSKGRGVLQERPALHYTKIRRERGRTRGCGHLEPRALRREAGEGEREREGDAATLSAAQLAHTARAQRAVHAARVHELGHLRAREDKGRGHGERWRGRGVHGLSHALTRGRRDSERRLTKTRHLPH